MNPPAETKIKARAFHYSESELKQATALLRNSICRIQAIGLNRFTTAVKNLHEKFPSSTIIYVRNLSGAMKIHLRSNNLPVVGVDPEKFEGYRYKCVSEPEFHTVADAMKKYTGDVIFVFDWVNTYCGSYDKEAVDEVDKSSSHKIVGIVELMYPGISGSDELYDYMQNLKNNDDWDFACEEVDTLLVGEGSFPIILNVARRN